MASRHWCFTLNGRTAETVSVDKLQQFCSYYVFQTELNSNGREHVQGFFTISGRDGWVLATIRTRLYDDLGGAHFEPARDVQASIAYCKKNGDNGLVPGTERVEWGVLPTIGRPNQKKKLADAIELMTELGGPTALAKEHPIMYATFSRQLEALWTKIRPKADMSSFEAREWQQKIIDLCTGRPDSRKIHWYVDYDGGKGKSYLARYLVCEKGAFYTQGGKHADIVHGYDQQRIIIFDLCRDVEGYVPYSVMETLKNGVMFSGKYNSAMQVFEIPHVLVFSNFDPDTSKLSRDRWDITTL